MVSHTQDGCTVKLEIAHPGLYGLKELDSDPGGNCRPKCLVGDTAGDAGSLEMKVLSTYPHSC